MSGGLPMVRYFATRAEAEAAGRAAAARGARLRMLSSGYAEATYSLPWLVEWEPARGPARVLTAEGWRSHAEGFSS